MIECGEYYLMDMEFREFFTYDEFCKLLKISSAIDSRTIVIFTEENYIEIASGYNPENRQEVQIFYDKLDENSNTLIDKNKLFEVIEKETITKAKYLTIDE